MSSIIKEQTRSIGFFKLAISACNLSFINPDVPLKGPKYRGIVMLDGNFDKCFLPNSYPFGEQNLQAVQSRTDGSDHRGTFRA